MSEIRFRVIYPISVVIICTLTFHGYSHSRSLASFWSSLQIRTKGICLENLIKTETKKSLKQTILSADQYRIEAQKHSPLAGYLALALMIFVNSYCSLLYNQDKAAQTQAPLSKKLTCIPPVGRYYGNLVLGALNIVAVGHPPRWSWIHPAQVSDVWDLIYCSSMRFQPTHTVYEWCYGY